MRIQGDMEAFSKTGALKMVEKLGFLNPSPRFLHWYFDKQDDAYMPIVDFQSLAEEVYTLDLASDAAMVAGLPPDNLEKETVFHNIKQAIRRHRIR
ncbi:MAG: hypothetical protein ABFQ53_02355 [Patescibacteria group bacterium]